MKLPRGRAGPVLSRLVGQPQPGDSPPFWVRGRAPRPEPGEPPPARTNTHLLPSFPIGPRRQAEEKR